MSGWGRRAGIGAQGAAQNVPPANLNPYPQGGGPPQQQQQSGGAGDDGWGAGIPAQEKYSLFVSGIPAKLEDRELEDILYAVGSFLKINRIRDAEGKPKGFGFVEYGDAESVLRCLALINGAQVTAADGEEKTLMVKADAKVRERLNTHEAGRMMTSELDDQTALCRDQLQQVLKTIAKKASAIEAGEAQEEIEYNPDGSKKFKIPAHLQDLEPGDLPEEQRELVTREIAFFRERAAKREEANRAAEDKRNQARKREEEERRRQILARSSNNNNSNAGSPRPDQGRGGFGQAPSQQQQHRPEYDSRGSRAASPPSGSSRYQRHDDPQSYNRPVGFVASSSNASSAGRQGTQMSDEDMEKARLKREQDANEREYQARLGRWQQKERARLQAIEREKQEKYAETKAAEKRRQETLDKCAHFDEEEEADRANGELFVVDRPRWRKYRQQARRREIEQDKRDQELEIEEAARLQKESEDFLARQAEMFASMTGLGTGEGTSSEPKKLSLLSAQPSKAKATAASASATSGEEAKPKPAKAVFGGDDEDESANKKKRELIPLSYSDDEDDETNIEKKKRKLKDLVSAIPTDKAELWQYGVRWDKLDETLLRNKMRPFAAQKSVEYLGAEEPEVVDTVLENMRAHKGPADLADELEPVLAEEAEEFVIKVYRHLNFELLSAVHGIST